MKEYRHPPGTGHLFERKCERHKEGGWYNRVIGSFVSTFFFFKIREKVVCLKPGKRRNWSWKAFFLTLSFEISSFF